MMMKLIKWGFVAWMIVFIGKQDYLHAQDFDKAGKKDLIKANEFLESGDTYKAIRIYKNLINDHGNDTSLMLSLSRAYSAANEHDKALYWIGKVVENPEIKINEPLIRFYVHELRMAGRYEIAKIWLEKIKLELQHESDTSKTRAIVFFEDTAYIQVTSLDFNTKESEFCPVFYRNSLLFYSNRQKPNQSKINLAGDAVADLYAISIEDNRTGKSPEIFNHLMGYGHYEGSFAFFDNYGQSILSKYLTSRKKLPTIENKLSGLRLYTALVDTSSDRIDYFNALPFNIHGYSVAHPNISEKGDVLYFASNIPGGYGGSDIYRSQYKNGAWSPPENLGPSVNSAFDEYFPYNYKNHTLFFTSNRPGGVGKFDMYKQNLDALQTAHLPVNLGIPVNSTEDDYCLVVSQNGKSGFFTSNRPGSKGKEDIFRFDLKTVSIQQVIDEILANDDFNHVMVNAAGNNTIVVEPMNKKANPGTDSKQNFKKSNTTRETEKTNSEPDDYSASTPKIHLTLQNPEKDASANASQNKETALYQQVQILVRKNGKTVYQSILPEDINLASFFDVKHEIKQSLGQLETHQHKINNETLSKMQQVKKTMFRVQIAACTKPMATTRLKEIYAGDREVFEFTEEGWYKYAIGDFNNYFVAVKVKETCGVNDAFIAAYNGNEKKPLMHAIETSHAYPSTSVAIPSENIMKHSEILFRFNEIEINESMRLKLDEILVALQAESNLHVSINGYTDFFGSERFNFALAGERARSVKEYFKSQGIRDERIRIVSKGIIQSESEKTDVLIFNPSDEAPYRKAELVLYYPQ